MLEQMLGQLGNLNINNSEMNNSQDFIHIYRKNHLDSSYYIIEFGVPENKSQADLLRIFEYRFEARDQRYTREIDDRFEYYPTKTKLTCTVVELAETFFAKYTSEEFAELLRPHLKESDSEYRILDTIKILDKYFQYGFIFEESRTRDKTKFWRIYSPELTNEELEKLIPKKYWSKSIYHKINGESHFSPLLKKGRNIDYKKAFTNRYSGVPKKDEFKIIKAKTNKGKIDSFDELRFRYLRRWHHPFMLLYPDQNRWTGKDELLPNPNLFEEAEPIKERMGTLEYNYPRLRSPELKQDLEEMKNSDPTIKEVRELTDTLRDFGLAMSIMAKALDQ